MPNKKSPEKLEERPPVIVVMGHIDHGKSTLLDQIRKTNLTEKEAGGITQHMGAYEVEKAGSNGKTHKITFLDTPGHEAFKAIRARGASVADVAILVVSAEDGVKPQTLEALQAIQKDSLPFVVAINKIDRPNADVEKTKQNLAENEIFLEGYGGNIPWVAVSAKTGEGIADLLDIVLLSSHILELKGDRTKAAEGVIIESNLDTKKGVSATVIIKDGTLKKGVFAVSGESTSPIRNIEDYQGKQIESATFSSPVKIIGWDNIPKVGEKFFTFESRKEAEKNTKPKDVKKDQPRVEAGADGVTKIPIIIKADTSGSLDALSHEIKKLVTPGVEMKIISANIGPISESDVKLALSNDRSLVVGFHTKTEGAASNLAERSGVTVGNFDIIYKLTEWLEGAVKERTPTKEVEKNQGVLKILKTFSQNKDKQVVGGRVESGTVSSGENIRIFRRESEIGIGRIKELQVLKQKVGSVSEGNECGALVESKTEIAPGDRLESYVIVKE